MSYFIPDARFENPALLIRNREPNGLLKVDWSLPITRGLVGAWTFTEDNGVCSDLTKNNNGEIAGSITTYRTNYGQGFAPTNDNASDRINLGSITAGNPLSCNVNNELSIYCFVKVPPNTSDPGNSYPRLIDKSTGINATNGWALYISSTPQRITLAIDTDTTAYVNYTIYGLGEVGIGVSLLFDANVNFFVNGSFIGNNSTIKTVPTTTASCSIGNWNHTTDRQFLGGIIYDIFVWNRGLSYKEQKLIHNNRYGMFIPD